MMGRRMLIIYFDLDRSKEYSKSVSKFNGLKWVTIKQWWIWYFYLIRVGSKPAVRFWRQI